MRYFLVLILAGLWSLSLAQTATLTGQSWSYSLALTGGVTYTIEALQQSSTPLRLQVYDPSNVRVAEVDGAPQVTLQATNTGTYQLYIYASGSGASFTLSVSQAGAAPSVSMPSNPSLPSITAPSSTEADPFIFPVGTGMSQDISQSILDAHNNWRSRYNTPPLRWSNDLAVFAQVWANELSVMQTLQHRTNNSYGENLFMSSGTVTPKEVIDRWGNEVTLYDPALNNWWPNAGHFSQVVWRDTTEVGCGVARSGGLEFWVCNYNPAGNITGQRPY